MKTSSMLSPKQKKAFTAGVVTLFAALAILVVDDELNSLRSGYIHQIRRAKAGRGLSLNLGGGDCEWKEPLAVVPTEIDLWKTLLVGFPSGDKRMSYVQMEALTGLPSKDDWDFVFNGYSNAPFIKTNYPHPAGTWSWGNEADQVALVVQYIRRSMVEYADIMWYLSYENTYNKDRVKLEELYGQRDDTDKFYIWRDAHVMQEIFRYGWYIDYWMENGLLRDPFTHNIIDQDNWNLWNEPEAIKNEREKVIICHRTNSKKNPMVVIEVSVNALQAHLDHGDFYGTCEGAANDPTFMNQNISLIHDGHGIQDPKCNNITNSCRPVNIISADKLRDYTDGPAETEIIGNILMTNEKMSKWVINQEAWDCIWDKVIDKNEGPMTFDDRDISLDPSFSQAMIEAMIEEVTRLLTKYSADPWTDDANANRLVFLLSEHLPLLQTELDELVSGRRTLSQKDIFMPGERQALFGQIT
ncbi:hypothetical protein ACHAWO_000048 [Cyclotella atomus]|uniref:Uncharacterized protein n=1 Tax=Cyclotella atomus TaxID=382360 RepID=A0ABD3QKY5_9STRA